MCFGGRSSPPPPPEPVAPAPPPVRSTSQVAPAPAGTSDEAPSYDAEGNVVAKKKGKSMLTIPLVTGTGSGLQIQ